MLRWTRQLTQLLDAALDDPADITPRLVEHLKTLHIERGTLAMRWRQREDSYPIVVSGIPLQLILTYDEGRPGTKEFSTTVSLCGFMPSHRRFKSRLAVVRTAYAIGRGVDEWLECFLDQDSIRDIVRNAVADSYTLPRL